MSDTNRLSDGGRAAAEYLIAKHRGKLESGGFDAAVDRDLLRSFDDLLALTCDRERRIMALEAALLESEETVQRLQDACRVAFDRGAAFVQQDAGHRATAATLCARMEVEN